MRAYVEKQIDLVAKGKAEKSVVVQHVLNQFLQKFKFFVMHISRMDVLFEATFSPLSSSGQRASSAGFTKDHHREALWKMWQVQAVYEVHSVSSKSALLSNL